MILYVVIHSAAAAEAVAAEAAAEAPKPPPKPGYMLNSQLYDIMIYC